MGSEGGGEEDEEEAGNGGEDERNEEGRLENNGNNDEDEEELGEFKKYTVEKILEGCETITEAKYLMQHLFDLCLEKAAIATKNEAENKVGSS
ncbi:unnamed protein product [Caenorhabditis bovis]|uniref:KIF21A/B second helical domain-containing protein n=1 Tax=Caenorhabditis bovis TaxID=2654633 RepID=A0A8S1F0W9_9PELO|nr:unnamed protein product [Caenorhabditis bovis]